MHQGKVKTSLIFLITWLSSSLSRWNEIRIISVLKRIKKSMKNFYLINLIVFIRSIAFTRYFTFIYKVFWKNIYCSKLRFLNILIIFTFCKLYIIHKYIKRQSYKIFYGYFFIYRNKRKICFLIIIIEFCDSRISSKWIT